MTDITLLPITSGYNVSKINGNFVEIQAAINNDILHLQGGNNVMLQDLDMNGNSLLNVSVDVTNPDSLLTVGDGDVRYYNVSGDTLTGTMNVNNQPVTNLKPSINPLDAVPKQELTAEINARTAADVSLQAQISESGPPLASAFSVVSWHDQNVANSVTIPANKNAWSFGPTITIDVGQTVTIGSGSFWTVANGEVQ